MSDLAKPQVQSSNPPGNAQPRPTNPIPSFVTFDSLVKDVEDKAEFPFTLIWGKSGYGKSYLLSSILPKPLILNFDMAGTNYAIFPRAKDFKIFSVSMEVVRGQKIKLYDELSRLFNEFAQRKGRFGKGGIYEDRLSIGIDSFSAMADMLFAQICLESGLPADAPTGDFRPYGPLYSRLEGLTNIAKSGGPIAATGRIEWRQVHSEDVIITEDTYKNKAKSESLYRPMVQVPGSYRDALFYDATEVYYFDCQTLSQGKERKIYLQPYKKYHAKSRFPEKTKSPLVLSEDPWKELGPLYKAAYKFPLEA